MTAMQRIPEFCRVSRIGEIVHGLSPDTVWRLIRADKLKGHRISGGTFVRISDLVGAIEGEGEE